MFQAVRLLVELGADVNLPHLRDGNSALGLAIEYGYVNTVRELVVELGADLDYLPPFVTSISPFKGVVDVLMGCGGDVKDSLGGRGSINAEYVRGLMNAFEDRMRECVSAGGGGGGCGDDCCDDVK